MAIRGFSLVLRWNLLVRNRALHGVGLLGIARVVSMACGLVTTVIWARYMPANVFGEFRVITSVVAFVAGFCLLGTAQVALMAASKNLDGSLAGVIRHKVAANCAGSIALLCAAGYYEFFVADSTSIAYGLIAAAFLFPLQNVSDIWMSWSNGKHRFNELAMANCLVALLSLLAVLVAALSAINSAWQITLISSLFIGGLNAIMMLRDLARRANTDVDPSLYIYGRHASLAMMFGSLLSLDVVIFNHFYSPEQVAEYAIALQLPLQLRAMLSVVGQVVAPRLYAASSLNESWHELRVPFLMLAGVMAGVGAIGFYILPPLTGFLFGERYADPAEYGKWLWLVLACTIPVTTFLGTALMATKRPVFLYGPHIGLSVSLTGLYLILVPLGIAGMVLARSITSIGLALFYIFTFAYLRTSSGGRAVY